MGIVMRVQRAAASSLVLVGLILGQLPVTGQTRHAGARQRPAAPAPPAQSAQPPRQQQRNGSAGEQARLVRSRKTRTMAESFASGKLPEPLRMPPGGTDERAAALAKAVSAGDASSTAALHAAVLAAGYGVRDADGSVMQTTERGQGLAFEAWEVAAVSKLYGEGYGVTLKHLSESFTRNVPEFRDVPLATVLLEGIRASAKSDHTAVRFWARFIVELGRHSQPAHDLLGQADAAKVRLDAAQTAFILKRLTGDMAVLERRGQQARSNPDVRGGIGRQHVASYRVASYFDESDGDQSADVMFVRAGMRRDGGGAMRTLGTTQSPCNFNELESLILDYNALGMTTAFGQLTEHLGGKVPGIDKYGKAASVANLILTVLKFIASYALLKTEITIDGQPLKRTKSHTESGEQRTLSAKLEMDSDKWQMLNCFRPALNAAGLDFNLPGAGPVKDVNVQWKLIEGGDSQGALLQGVQESFAIVLGKKLPPTDAIVGFQTLPGADLSAANQYTDDNGVSRIDVVGQKQARDLSKEKLTEVDKVAGVRVDVQLKPMKIKDGVGAASNLGDIAGNVIAFLTGDFLGGAVGTLAETMYRSNWHRSEPFYFLVKDWEPCEGWSGTITQTEGFKDERNESGGSGGSSWKREHHKEFEYHAVINLVYDQQRSVGDVYDNRYPAQASASGSVVSSGGVENRGTSSSFDKRWGSESKEDYRGNVSAKDTSVVVNIRSDGTYSVSYAMPCVEAPGTRTIRRFTLGSGFPDFQRKDETRSNPVSGAVCPTQQGGLGDGRHMGITGQLDPKNPGTLSGSKTFEVPLPGNREANRKITITWNLTRCK